MLAYCCVNSDTMIRMGLSSCPTSLLHHALRKGGHGISTICCIRMGMKPMPPALELEISTFVQQSASQLLRVQPQAYATPLVGVWVSGVSSATHPIVWLACLKYYASSQLQDKASQGDQAFLLLLYTSGESGHQRCCCCLPGSCSAARLFTLPWKCTHSLIATASSKGLGTTLLAKSCHAGC